MHLEICNLYKRFNTKQGNVLALKNINLHVETGEFVCVVGASGSGKSTLLRIIAGLELPTAGEIIVDRQPVIGPGSDRGMVFQKETLYPWLNVAENVGFGLKLQGVNPREQKKIVANYLDVVGLWQFAKSYPRQLSGGMKQRVAIARALACQPKIMLMDEPFGALDVQTKETMQEFLLQIWQRTGTTILMITHDVEEAVFLSERIYVLTKQPGTIRAEIAINLPNSQYRDNSGVPSYEIKRNSSFNNYKYKIMDLLRQDIAL
jgi:NitT/TauT family transport system ATP-binding protein